MSQLSWLKKFRMWLISPRFLITQQKFHWETKSSKQTTQITKIPPIQTSALASDALPNFITGVSYSTSNQNILQIFMQQNQVYKWLQSRLCSFSLTHFLSKYHHVSTYPLFIHPALLPPASLPQIYHFYQDLKTLKLYFGMFPSLNTLVLLYQYSRHSNFLNPWICNILCRQFQ